MRAHLTSTALICTALLASACSSPSTSDPDDVGETDTDAPDTDTDDDTEDALTFSSVRGPFGAVGDTVELVGSGFTAATALAVTLGGSEAPITSVTDEVIEVTVPDLMPGTYAFTVSSAEGALAPIDFEVRLPPRLYVVDDPRPREAMGRVSVYTIGQDRTLTAHASSPVTTDLESDFGFGGVPGSLAVDAPRRRLYATGRSGLAFYAIDGATGALTPHVDSPLLTGTGENFGVAVDAAGEHLYVTRCRDLDLAHFLVGADGSLTAAPTPTYDLDTCADRVLITPDGTRVYTADGDNVFGFTVGAQGALTPFEANPMPFTQGQSYGWSFNPAATRIYAGAYEEQHVAVYDLAASTGALSAFEGSPFTAPGIEPEPSGVQFTHDGKHAYVALFGAAGVARFAVAADGSLTYGETVPTAEQPAPMALSADGSLLIVASQTGHAVEAFHVASDGTLTSTGPSVDVGETTYPQGVAITGL